MPAAQRTGARAQCQRRLGIAFGHCRFALQQGHFGTFLQQARITVDQGKGLVQPVHRGGHILPLTRQAGLGAQVVNLRIAQRLHVQLVVLGTGQARHLGQSLGRAERIDERRRQRRCTRAATTGQQQGRQQTKPAAHGVTSAAAAGSAGLGSSPNQLRQPPPLSTSGSGGAQGT